MLSRLVMMITLAGLSTAATAGNGIERYVQINFDKAQEMSERAQEKLQRVINMRCQPSASTASAVSAKLTDVSRNRVDNGIIDVTYTVDVKFHGWDQYEQELATVRLTDYAGTNPGVDWVEIEEIKTTIEGLCK